jgi:hypothetical protein
MGKRHQKKNRYEALVSVFAASSFALLLVATFQYHSLDSAVTSANQAAMLSGSMHAAATCPVKAGDKHLHTHLKGCNVLKFVRSTKQK